MAKDCDPLNLTDTEEEERLRQEKAAMLARIERDDTVWVMRTRQGRRVIYRFIAQAGVWKTSFHTNALQMSFNEGQRNMGLVLLAKLTEYCEDSYALMLKEHSEDE